MADHVVEGPRHDRVSEAALRRLVDESEIRNVLLDYARAADRCDLDLMRSIYHPDAHDDHGFFSGGVDDFLDWFRARHETIVQSVHFLGNIRIEFVDDATALVETYVRSSQRSRPSGPDGPVQEHVSDARVLDRFERRDGTWRIAHRRLVFETSEIRTVADDGFPPGVTTALHSTDDVSYAFLREHRAGARERGA